MIEIVYGKPGAGKSYHAVRSLIEDLSDRLCRGGELPLILTNLKLNADAVHNALKAEVRKVDIPDFHDLICNCESDLTDPARFVTEAPENCFVIIDEAQFYFGGVAQLSREDTQKIIEAFSTHRHRRQHWLLITQHLTSISVDVRRFSEKVSEVLNAKSMSLPFPISIPLKDIQTLLFGFGRKNQIYRVKEGRLDGTYKVEWEGLTSIQKTNARIFKCYQTNDSGTDTDEPLPFALGKGQAFRALKWFFFRHGLHLTLKVVVVLVIGITIYMRFFSPKSGNENNSLDSVKTVKASSVKGSKILDDDVHGTSVIYCNYDPLETIYYDIDVRLGKKVWRDPRVDFDALYELQKLE